MLAGHRRSRRSVVKRRRLTAGALAAALLALAVPAPLVAYGGPGSVVSTIGAFLAALAAIVAAIFGFIWFPLKRLYRKIFGRGSGEGEEGGEEGA